MGQKPSLSPDFLGFDRAPAHTAEAKYGYYLLSNALTGSQSAPGG